MRLPVQVYRHDRVNGVVVSGGSEIQCLRARDRCCLVLFRPISSSCSARILWSYLRDQYYLSHQ